MMGVVPGRRKKENEVEDHATDSGVDDGPPPASPNATGQVSQQHRRYSANVRRSSLSV